MDKLQQLIEWMEEEFENELGEDSISIGARGAFRFCLSKAKQLQAEPTEKVYSEEDMHIIDRHGMITLTCNHFFGFLNFSIYIVS